MHNDSVELVGKTVVVAPSTEPVTLSEAKAFARVDTTAEDTLITDLIAAAREIVEEYTDRQLMQATYDLAYDRWPSSGVLEIPYAPTSSITSVKYIDSAGVQQTLAGSVYSVDADIDPARIYLAYNQTWPTIRHQRHAITVRAVVGYADADSVPEAIKTAIKMTVTSWIYDREGCGALPEGARKILDRYRFRYGS